MACLQVYQELLSLATFLRVHSNSKEVSSLSWQNLKTTFHVKLKLFLWTKLLENLLLAKYLKSAAATLKDDIYGMRWWGLNIKCFSVFSSSLDSRLISLMEGDPCTSKYKSIRCFVGFKTLNKTELANVVKVVVLSFTEV